MPSVHLRECCGTFSQPRNCFASFFSRLESPIISHRQLSCSSLDNGAEQPLSNHSVTHAGRSSAAASDRFRMSAFSSAFLSTGLHSGKSCCWSYSNSLGWSLFIGPMLFNSFKYAALGDSFQLLHLLLSVLCSCVSDILPCTDNTTSVRDGGLGSLSRDLAEVTHINKTQVATQSHSKYSSWSCIITHSIVTKGCECIFKHLSIKSQNILLRYCKLGDKGINLPNADTHLLQKLNSTSQQWTMHI